MHPCGARARTLACPHTVNTHMQRRSRFIKREPCPSSWCGFGATSGTAQRVWLFRSPPPVEVPPLRPKGLAHSHRSPPRRLRDRRSDAAPPRARSGVAAPGSGRARLGGCPSEPNTQKHHADATAQQKPSTRAHLLSFHLLLPFLLMFASILLFWFPLLLLLLLLLLLPLTFPPTLLFAAQVDLVPKEVAAGWLAVLRRSAPVVAFKASTAQTVGRASSAQLASAEAVLGEDALQVRAPFRSFKRKIKPRKCPPPPEEAFKEPPQRRGAAARRAFAPLAAAEGLFLPVKKKQERPCRCDETFIKRNALSDEWAPSLMRNAFRLAEEPCFLSDTWTVQPSVLFFC